MNAYNKIRIDMPVKFNVNLTPREKYAQKGEKARVTAVFENEWNTVMCATDLFDMFVDAKFYIGQHMPKLIGMAVCSVNDEFNEAVGKELALCRLYKQLWNNILRLYNEYLDEQEEKINKQLVQIDAATYCAMHELDYFYNKIMQNEVVDMLDHEEVAEEISEVESE